MRRMILIKTMRMRSWDENDEVNDDVVEVEEREEDVDIERKGKGGCGS